MVAELLKQEIKLICRILQVKMSNKASSTLNCTKKKEREKTIVTILPDKKLQFQLFPCYILQKRIGDDLHCEIPA